jgi:hypothetical protein
MFTDYIPITHEHHTHIKCTIDHTNKHASLAVFPVTLSKTPDPPGVTVNLNLSQWSDFTVKLEPMPRLNRNRLKDLLREHVKRIKDKDEGSEAYQLFQKCLAI